MSLVVSKAIALSALESLNDVTVTTSNTSHDDKPD